jgi:hypothetical protein
MEDLTWWRELLTVAVIAFAILLPVVSLLEWRRR